MRVLRLRTALCGELVVRFSLIKAIIQSREVFARVFLSRIIRIGADFVLATYEGKLAAESVALARQF
jgi:hypothetical protein